MKKKELEVLEKINQEKQLPDEIKEKIAKRALDNFLIATDILLLFVLLMVAAIFLEKFQTIIIYKCTSMALIVFTVVLFEVAYKKENDQIAINGIEMLFVSIITLLAPYIFLKEINTYTAIVGAYFTAYYILKNLIIYKRERKNFLREKSDISQIIKKESQDEMAKEQKSKLEKAESKKPAKKRGRPKKVSKQGEKV